jgi:23S rRNA pseudouridine1911/1915/1917 synthase
MIASMTRNDRETPAGRAPRGGTQWTVEAASAGQRLDKFLAAADRAGSRSRAGDAIARGRVFVNDVEAAPSDGARLVAAGDAIRLWMDRPGSAARPVAPGARGGLAIAYEDDDLVVVNKPAGLLTVPLDNDGSEVDPRAAPSVLDLLQQRFRSHGGREPLVVHRIDRDTSGVVLFALNARTHAALVAQFADRTPERVYQAVLYGRPAPPEGTWHDRLVWDEAACMQRTPRAGELGAIDAISRYRVVETFAETSLVEVRLDTGRQGQIRVQAQIHGHALVGDRRYRDRTGRVTQRLAFPRQALHAHQLVFEHPADRRRLEIGAPPPDDLRKLLARLRQGN